MFNHFRSRRAWDAKRSSFVLCCVAALGLPAAAASAAPLTLDAVLDAALARNPALLAARQELEIARARLQKARYWNPFNPMLEAGAAARRFDGGGSDVQPSGAISLEIEIAGQRSKRIEEARRNLDRVEAEVADVERLLTAQVKENFYRALYLRKRLGLSREVEGLNRRLRDASMQRFQAGEAPKIEANLAIARHVQSSKETLAAERDHQNAVRDLERLTGNEPTGETGLAGNLDVLPVEVGMERLVQVALQARPDLRARQVEIDRVKAETALTRRLIAPNTIIRGVYEEEAEVTGERDWIAGGTLGISLPLFDRKQAELSALAAEHSRARHQRTDAMLSVQNEVRNAYWTYDAARKATQLFEVEALESVSEGYRLIETAYREGKIGLVDLVVVQNDLVRAQLSYLDSLWDYWAAHVALERAVGQPLEREALP